MVIAALVFLAEVASERIPFCTHFAAIFPMASFFPIRCFDADRASHIHIVLCFFSITGFRKANVSYFFFAIAPYLHIHNQFFSFLVPVQPALLPLLPSPLSHGRHSLRYHHILPPPPVHHEKVFTSASAG